MNFDLANVLYSLVPKTYLSKEIDYQTTKDIRSLFELVLTQLQSVDIEITAIVTDGLKSQCEALNYLSKKSIQFQNSEQYGKIIHVPCIAHKLSNVIKYTYRTNFSFRQLIDKSRQLVLTLRKSKFKGGRMRLCPLFVETRWAYDSTIVTFLVQHSEAIIAFLENNRFDQPFPDELDMIVDILSEMRSLIMKVEANQTLISAVYPLVEQAQSLFNEWQQDCPNPIRKSILSTFVGGLERYFFASTRNFFPFVYSLSPSGKKRIQKIIFGQEQEFYQLQQSYRQPWTVLDAWMPVCQYARGRAITR
jgi:hypothetical protein